MTTKYTIAGFKRHGNPYQPSARKPEHIKQWNALKSRIHKEGPLTFEQVVATIEPYVSDAQRKRGGARGMARYLINQPPSGVAALIED